MGDKMPKDDYYQAEKANAPFSQVLQEGLKTYLNL
jgi:hypothetical protein